MISVIVPVYNVEKYIRACLDSIINQTYQDLEILLIDDGSTDSSGAICDEYAGKDARIKVIHKENGGQSSARNVGLQMARGEYVGFVDSDDTIQPNMFKALLEAIQNVDIAICGHSVVLNTGVKTACTGDEKTLDERALWQEIFEKLNNAVWNKLFRRSLMDGLFFDTRFAHGEDLIFNLQYLKAAKTGRIIDQPLYEYYKRGDSITTGAFTPRKLLEISSKDEALRIVEELYPSMKKTAEKYCFRARMNVMRAIYRAGKEEEYKAELKEYKGYAYRQYKHVKQGLKLKERIEFFCLKHCPRQYVKFAKRYN